MDNKYFEGAGNIRISEDVLCTIVSVAAMEVEGVHAMAQRSGADIKGLITPKKTAGKGVRIELDSGQVRVDLTIVVGMGVKIPDVVARLQANVKQAIESMTGMTVAGVDVYVQGMDTSKLSGKPPAVQEEEEPPKE
ncbi:MAG: Asp23/Gls24 family envelope stress response protein [Clostridiales bacterium]|nr:Asp23/Gls24 family envelope stress response protein [Clostridiales bacterium]